MHDSIILLDLYALRLCDGLEEHLRSGLSKQEETSHDLGETPGAAVPRAAAMFHIVCGDIRSMTLWSDWIHPPCLIPDLIILLSHQYIA